MIIAVWRSATAAWDRRAIAAEIFRISLAWLQRRPQSFPLWQQKALSRTLVFVGLLVPILLHEKNISHRITIAWISLIAFKEIYEFIITGNRDARWTDAERARAGAIAGAINEVGELLRHNKGQNSKPIDKRVVTANLLRALEDDVKRLTEEEGSISMIMSLLKPKTGGGNDPPEMLETVSISQNLGPHQFKEIWINSAHPPAVAYRENCPQILPDTKTGDCQELRNHPTYRSMVAFPITFNGSSGEVIAVAVIIASRAQVFTPDTVDRRFEEVIMPYLRLLAVLETIA